MNQARKSPVIDVIQLRDSEETIKTQDEALLTNMGWVP